MKDRDKMQKTKDHDKRKEERKENLSKICLNFVRNFAKFFLNLSKIVYRQI